MFLFEVTGDASDVARFLRKCADAKNYADQTRPVAKRAAKYHAIVAWLAPAMRTRLTINEGPTRVSPRELAPPRREPQEGEASILYRGCTNETEARAYRERAEAKAGHRLRPKPDYDNIRPLPKWANPGPTDEAEIARRWGIGTAADLRRLVQRFRDYTRRA